MRDPRPGAALLCAVALAFVALGHGSAGAIADVGLRARLVPTPVSRSTASFETWTCAPTDPDACVAEAMADGTAGRTTTNWRVVLGTGNCCEIHTGVSSDGRLFDIGGSYLNYSDDRGQTWMSVRPQENLVNGEGSVVTAPNGDILAVEWDPYSGDHLLAYKYTASVGTWTYFENPVHEVFFDRPWISVVPGPFATATGTVPYIAFIQGGGVTKDPMLMSTDGLIYETPSTTVVGLVDGTERRWFPITADASFDWTQPITSSPVTPLGVGRAAARGGVFTASWLLDPATMQWHLWWFPDNSAPPSFVQVDSAGRVHDVENLGTAAEYRVSSDGGETWSTLLLSIKMGSINDLKVNAALGIAVWSTRIDDQDWVFAFDVTAETAQLRRIYKLGRGDLPAPPGLNLAGAPRFDFKTISILPDGRIATSFMDSTTTWQGSTRPALAVELDTN